MNDNKRNTNGPAPASTEQAPEEAPGQLPDVHTGRPDTRDGIRPKDGDPDYGPPDPDDPQRFGT